MAMYRRSGFYGRYGGRGVAWGRRGIAVGRWSAGGKYRGGGLNVKPTFIAGLAAAFLVNLPPVVNTAAVVAATAPVRVKGFAYLQTTAQGYLLGKAIQSFIGNPLQGAIGAQGSGINWS